MRRSLSLKRESLAALTTDEMAGVAGGSHAGCPTHGYSCEVCPTPTLPVNLCVQEVVDCVRSKSCAQTR